MPLPRFAELMLPRFSEHLLRRALANAPAVALSGARQTGKTTLLRTALAASHRYVALDAPDVRARAMADPALFLDLHPPPVMFDEIQEAPELLAWLRPRVDADRDARGQYVLTGSQSLTAMAQITQSLAGRVALLELDTMSLAEQLGRGNAPPEATELGTAEIARRMVRGGFPELVAHEELDADLWHRSYIRTYLERDLRQLRNVGSLGEFQRLLVLLATRAGQQLDLSDLSRDLGVAVNTVKAWVDVLEAGQQIVQLRPWFANVGKRFVKRPKVYFRDTGTLCWLLGVDANRDLGSLPFAGAIFENAVFGELWRQLSLQGRAADLMYMRTSDGIEVDFVVDSATGPLRAIEAKWAGTLRADFATGLHKLAGWVAGRPVDSLVVTAAGPPQAELSHSVRVSRFDVWATGGWK